MAKRRLLDEADRGRLVKLIEEGTHPKVAALTVGVELKTFKEWLERGEKGERPHAELLGAVRRAQAEARGAAERRAWEKNPLVWLREGPGRAVQGVPAWTAAPQSGEDDEWEEGDPADLAEILRSLEEWEREQEKERERLGRVPGWGRAR